MTSWKTRSVVPGLLFLLLLASLAAAQGRPAGVVGQQAPDWDVKTWFNLPEGQTSIDIDDFRGKVVYLYGFQSWCPGCHSSGFPTLKSLVDQYQDNDDVAFIAIQTVFEGYRVNTPEKAKATGERYDLDIPIGHTGQKGLPVKFMRDYRTRGTPWTIIIDRSGVVRFNDFHLKPQKGREIIDTLLKQPPREPAIKTLPPSRGGQDLIGTRFPKMTFDGWPRRAEASDKATKPAKATLYRWWTDTCPWCEASLPAIETLRDTYGQLGLRTVAVYHPKPPRQESDAAILQAAHTIGYDGDVAADLDWSELNRVWLNSGKRQATSVSFLVDDRGIIRFVHPGPVFHPSTDPAQAERDSDYRLLEEAIKTLVSAPDKSTPRPRSD